MHTKTAGVNMRVCVLTHILTFHTELSNHFSFCWQYNQKNLLFPLHVSTLPAPCVPRNAHGGLDCVTNSAWVTWDPSDGATSYVAMAQEADGHNSSCISSSSPCAVPDLKCGTTYTFHVTAANRHCSSNHSESFEIETGMEEVWEWGVEKTFCIRVKLSVI